MHDKYVLHPEQFKLIYSKYGDESVYESKEPLSSTLSTIKPDVFDWPISFNTRSPNTVR